MAPHADHGVADADRVEHPAKAGPVDDRLDLDRAVVEREMSGAESSAIEGTGNLGSGHGRMGGGSEGSGFGAGHGRLGGSEGLGLGHRPTPPTTGLGAPADHAAEDPVENPSATPTTADPLATVQSVVDKFGSANIAFNPPKSMIMGDKKLVELLLSPAETQAALRSGLPAEDQGSAETAAVQVAPRMEARLTGLGFAVESLSPPEQAVGKSQRARWSWLVAPTAEGIQFLHLSLSARISVEGHDTPFVVRTFDREIAVKVTTMQRLQTLISEHGGWAWGAIGVPVFGYLLERYRKRRKQQGKVESDHG